MTVTERGAHGATRILVDNLGDSFEEVGKDLKASIWESDDGERRLYLRVRDSEDRRKFNEFSVDLPQSVDTDSDREGST